VRLLNGMNENKKPIKIVVCCGGVCFLTALVCRWLVRALLTTISPRDVYTTRTHYVQRLTQPTEYGSTENMTGAGRMLIQAGEELRSSGGEVE
jgi:hypothetical protein